VVGPGPGDTVLIGGAGGGVGLFAVRLARLAGARVIGTGSATSADALRALGAEPVAYGDGLVDRVRALAPAGVTAVMDLHGTGHRAGGPGPRRPRRPLAACFPVERIRAAVELQAGRHVPGKLVIDL
jgi:threonine dehydrogenase-like Zn-dependent dehydrogenase